MPDLEGTGGGGGPRGIRRGVEPWYQSPGVNTRGFRAKEQDEPRWGHILADAMPGTRQVSGDQAMNSPRCTQTLGFPGS